MVICVSLGTMDGTPMIRFLAVPFPTSLGNDQIIVVDDVSEQNLAQKFQDITKCVRKYFLQPQLTGLTATVDGQHLLRFRLAFIESVGIKEFAETVREWLAVKDSSSIYQTLSNRP